MASWDELASRIDGKLNPVDQVRKDCVRRLAEIDDRNVICYYSGWLQNGSDASETTITDNDIEGLIAPRCTEDTSPMPNSRDLA